MLDIIPPANLTYEIPAGVADDLFTIDAMRGIISTRAPLDREAQDLYTIPVYVTDASTPIATASGARSGRSEQQSNSQSDDMFDVATVFVRVSDQNDHAPEFRAGSCHPLMVPENVDTSIIIHTIVATDLDVGANGEIAYAITGKFAELGLNCL